jgi:MerR family transcriptional regulator, aldehyde-responsive regulator
MNISEVSKKFDITQDTLRYYERVGMIPRVNRTTGGIRDYTEEDCKWVELAKCMRSAGLPIEVMIEYLKLTQQGDGTIPARHELLLEQREQLLAQKAAIESTVDRLNYKIGRYEKAMETGVLVWDHDNEV